MTLLTTLPVAALLAVVARPALGQTERFRDSFDSGLRHWIVAGSSAVDVHDAGGDHGRVLRLRADGDVHALVRGSDRWGDLAIEGEVLFPKPGDAYLGVVYGFREERGRQDFGLIYLKVGRRNYLQANPHRDYNVTRTFYPEFEAPLAGASDVRIGEWQRFRMEVVAGVAHFYVGDVHRPQLTFPIPESHAGLVGLQPRSVGNEVWVDNVVVSSIARHRYQGPPIPATAATRAQPSGLRWDVLGPLARTEDGVVRGAAPQTVAWRPLHPDPRGGIATAEVVDFHGPNTVAYFRTRVHDPVGGTAVLRFSSVDDLALWVNGRFQGFLAAAEHAWADVGENRDHPGTRVGITLRSGVNEIVLRVRGGRYAAGGFFARVERDAVLLASPAELHDAANAERPITLPLAHTVRLHSVPTTRPTRFGR